MQSAAVDIAQELIDRAWETTGSERKGLARRALALWPDAADAYVLLALETEDLEERRQLHEEGIQAGERALGPETLQESVGHFWGLLQTRPYMRACQGMAVTLWSLGRRDAAIEQAQAMLGFNPNDNQGIRYLLATWLLTQGEDEALSELLSQYPDDGSAEWLYTTALLRFRQEGRGTQADAVLRDAFRANPYVPLYLVGGKRLPKHLPEQFSMGEDSEAVSYVADALPAWTETPGALAWVVAGLARALVTSTQRSTRYRR